MDVLTIFLVLLFSGVAWVKAKQVRATYVETGHLFNTRDEWSDFIHVPIMIFGAGAGILALLGYIEV